MATNLPPACCGALPSRRAVVAGSGVAAAALLAACASDAGAGPAAGEASPSEPGQAEAGGQAGGAVVATLADVPVGSAVILLDPAVVLTQPSEGTVEAYDATCPHAGCAVAQVEDDQIICPCHGSRFSATDGSVLSGPATSGLTRTDVTVEGDDIVLG